MSFSIGSVVATVTADISGFRDGMKQVEKSAENFQTKLQSVGSKLTDFGKNMTLVSTVVGAGLTMFLKDSSLISPPPQVILIHCGKPVFVRDIISGLYL